MKKVSIVDYYPCSFVVILPIYKDNIVFCVIALSLFHQGGEFCCQMALFWQGGGLQLFDNFAQGFDIVHVCQGRQAFDRHRQQCQKLRERIALAI